MTQTANRQPLVSIITPSFNQAGYLEATILSVLDQGYPNIEYLIADGGSHDGSVQIIEKYASRLAWWVSEKDRGQGDAINKGFGHSKGEIVAWLNSDDLYLPDAVEQAVALFGKYPDAGMVFGNAITIDAAGRPLNPLVFGDWELADLLRFQIICQPAVFIRRSVLQRAGFLDSSYQYLLDHQLWLRIAAAAPIVHANAFWAAARHHSQAKNVAHAGEFADEVYRILHWIREHPALKDNYAADKLRIKGGGSRLAARYLLEGGLPAKAFWFYTKALVYWPAENSRYWYRMLFALLSIFGGNSVRTFYDRFFRKPRIAADSLSYLDGWHGICLDS